MTEFIISALGVLGVSNVITFVLTKRRYNTEVDSQQIENMNKSFDIYKKMMEESMSVQNKRIDALQRENESLRQQVYQLQQQLITLTGRFIAPTNPTSYNPLEPTV